MLNIALRLDIYCEDSRLLWISDVKNHAYNSFPCTFTVPHCPHSAQWTVQNSGELHFPLHLVVLGDLSDLEILGDE